MPREQRVFVVAALLLLIGLLGSPAPARSAAAGRLPLEADDQALIDDAGPDGQTVTPQTPFILGSTSKSITALAVMQLVEAGTINLDAPVTTYLPWFRTADAAASARITVRHLLNQNSGLPVDVGRAGLAEDDQSDTALENGVRRLAGVQLGHPPGQAYEYANENYSTLGLIVQAVSGRSYEEYIQSAIFAPLQMRHSAASISHPAASALATGHRYWLGWPVPFTAPYPRQMTPAGFLIPFTASATAYFSTTDHRRQTTLAP